MTLSPAYAMSFEAIDGVSQTPFRRSQKPFLKPSMPSHLEGKADMRANGLNDRTVTGHRRQNTSIREVKDENKDWLSAQLSKHPVSHVVNCTGMTEKGVQNIRGKKAKISFDNLVELCRADPTFAAAFAEYVGLLLPGEAEFTGAFNRAVSAYHNRRKG